MPQNLSAQFVWLHWVSVVRGRQYEERTYLHLGTYLISENSSIYLVQKRKVYAVIQYALFGTYFQFIIAKIHSFLLHKFLFLPRDKRNSRQMRLRNEELMNRYLIERKRAAQSYIALYQLCFPTCLKVFQAMLFYQSKPEFAILLGKITTIK